MLRRNYGYAVGTRNWWHEMMGRVHFSNLKNHINIKCDCNFMRILAAIVVVQLHPVYRSHAQDSMGSSVTRSEYSLYRDSFGGLIHGIHSLPCHDISCAVCSCTMLYTNNIIYIGAHLMLSRFSYDTRMWIVNVRLCNNYYIICWNPTTAPFPCDVLWSFLFREKCVML